MRNMSFREKVSLVQVLFLVAVMVIGCANVVAMKVCVNKLHMDNAILRHMLPLGDFRLVHVPKVDIDWKEKFPFDAANQPPVVKKKWYSGLNEKWKEKIQKQGTTFTESLPYKNQVKEEGRRIEQLVGWTIVPAKGSSYLVPGESDYWSNVTAEKDVSSGANGLKRLNEYCNQQGISFLYVQAPGRIQKDKDPFLLKYRDYSNENVDRFLEKADELGVNYVDLRTPLASLTPTEYHSLFFRTDHHWKPETALMATRYLARLLNERNGFSIDADALSIENFEQVLYPHQFLGSIGKNLTLARTMPDDLTLLYPKFNVDVEYEIPTKAYDERGDFSVLYDMTQVEPVDYYAPGGVQEPYGAYGHADFPLAKIRSFTAKDQHKILLIKDSYGRPVSTFLGLMVAQVDIIDPRAFPGSVENYIAQTKPDAVIVLYSAGLVNAFEHYSTRETVFDLR